MFNWEALEGNLTIQMKCPACKEVYPSACACKQLVDVKPIGKNDNDVPICLTNYGY